MVESTALEMRRTGNRTVGSNPTLSAKFKGAAFGSSLRRLAPLAPALLLLVPAPAAAQLAGSVGLDSDYRLRGYSLTDNDPALSAQISYDESSGLYFSLSALTELGHGTRFLGVIGNAGYAKRLNEHLTVEGGVIRSQIRSASQYNAGHKYTEVYAGAFVGPISGRIYYSPDYRNGDQSTLYGELESGFEFARNWRLSGHVGRLIYLSSAPFEHSGYGETDWRIAVSRDFGNLEIHSALSGAGPGGYTSGADRKRAAFTVGTSLNF